MRFLPLSLAVTALSLAAAPAHAGTVTFGSDLTADATIEHNRPNDSVYWNDAIASGGGVAATVTGQVIKVEIKGRIVPSQEVQAGKGEPWNVVHFQVLRPRDDGRYYIPEGSTSTDYHMPWEGSDNQITTFRTTHQYDALCVKPGDRVDFATLGGFSAELGYGAGTPFRVFGRVPGSRVLQYSAQGTEGVNNGETIRPQDVHEDQELLMRVTVGTGDDARPACRGPEESTSGGSGDSGSAPKPAGPRVTLPSQSPRLRARHILSVAAYCHLKTAPCRGRLTARAKGKKIGTTRYTIRAGDTEGVRFRFNRTGRKLFRRNGKRLRVTITVVTEPGGAANTDRRTLRVTSMR